MRSPLTRPPLKALRNPLSHLDATVPNFALNKGEL
jgi:hypothetical protein